MSGRGQTEAAHALCRNLPQPQKQHFVSSRCGHYDIFSSQAWRDLIYPKVSRFIRGHSGSVSHP
jgi:poly(3-hydroxybutyrate) depolymerase